MKSNLDAPDWSTIPAPLDDGATRHLSGARMARIALPATGGAMVDLSALRGRTIVYAYPRTGTPGADDPDGWDMIPGARGCTPQTCSFRDHFAELEELGVDHLFGLSTQSREYQREAAARLHLPFEILSDEKLELTREMGLPTFTTAGMTLLKRFTLVIEDGRIDKVFYPVFPPDRNASDVIDYLSRGEKSPAADTAAGRRFPVSAGILFGLGLGGFFDGIVLHQILQWHHMVTSAGYPADSVENLQLNTLLDGLFHTATYVFVVLGLIQLWRSAHRAHLWWSGRMLVGTILMGFGIFNLIEGAVNHQLLGLHHVNETVPREQWIWWDLGFLLWGAAMLVGGWLLLRRGRHISPGEPS